MVNISMPLFLNSGENVGVTLNVFTFDHFKIHVLGFCSLQFDKFNLTVYKFYVKQEKHTCIKNIIQINQISFNTDELINGPVRFRGPWHARRDVHFDAVHGERIEHGHDGAVHVRHGSLARHVQPRVGWHWRTRTKKERNYKFF